MKEEKKAKAIATRKLNAKKEYQLIKKFNAAKVEKNMQAKPAVEPKLENNFCKLYFKRFKVNIFSWQ